MEMTSTEDPPRAPLGLILETPARVNTLRVAETDTIGVIPC